VAQRGHRDDGPAGGGKLRCSPSPGDRREGQSKGSGSLGARSGTVATRHPQADPGHEPQAPKEPDPKNPPITRRPKVVLRYRKDDILRESGLFNWSPGF